MIRDFILGDENKLKPNAFSDPTDVRDIFTDDTYKKFTLEDGEKIVAITCWKEYAPDEYAIFMLMCDEITASNTRELKRLLDNATIQLKPKRCITYSFDCDMLNRWHEFWGFKSDPANGVLIEGKKFNKWVIEWA